ncbi:kinesin-like protein, partial [Kipferlia bialata]
RQSIGHGVHVSGALEEVVQCPEDVMKAIKRGEQRRQVGSTNMNARSSRSHCVLRVFIESTSSSLENVTNRRCSIADMGISCKSSLLTLVDLAGIDM